MTPVDPSVLAASPVAPPAAAPGVAPSITDRMKDFAVLIAHEMKSFASAENGAHSALEDKIDAVCSDTVAAVEAKLTEMFGGLDLEVIKVLKDIGPEALAALKKVEGGAQTVFEDVDLCAHYAAARAGV